MTTPTIRVCPITGQELPHDRYAAPAAAGQLRADLANLPDLLGDLLAAYTRQVTMPQIGGGSPQDERLPYNPAAAEARRQLLMTVCITVDHLAHTNHDPVPQTAAQIARYLSTHADQLTRTETGTQQLQELAAAFQYANRTIDRPMDRTYAGPCPNCQTDLTAPHGADHAPCPGCGDLINIDENREWMNDALRHMILPAHQARYAAQLIARTKITRHDLRNWTLTGKLSPRPHHRAETAYLVGELATLAEAKPQRRTA